jgi:hypothetical protein
MMGVLMNNNGKMMMKHDAGDENDKGNPEMMKGMMADMMNNPEKENHAKMMGMMKRIQMMKSMMQEMMKMIWRIIQK